MNEQMLNIIRNYFSMQPVLKAWLFGSYSRGDQTENSDIDILIALDKTKPIGLKFFKMNLDLEELLGKQVDLVSDGKLQPFAQTTADNDKVLIYERADKR